MVMRALSMSSTCSEQMELAVRVVVLEPRRGRPRDVCPKLEAPKPELCTAPAETPSARAEQWHSFQRAVLARDLGAARADRVLAEMAMAAQKCAL
jgi:hypothetical protein